MAEISVVYTSIQAAFPGVPLFVALGACSPTMIGADRVTGNNDVFLDYCFNETYQQAVSTVIMDSLLCKGCKGQSEPQRNLAMLGLTLQMCTTRTT